MLGGSGMNADSRRIIVVTGATGRQGSAVARALLQDGWHVRALTRNPNSKKAQALAAEGAEVVQGNMEDPKSLQNAFRGAYGVFSVQNPMISGIESEVRQGKLVADAAKEANVRHLVYASTGIGEPTGIGSWDSKLEVEAHMKAQGIPLTILRPMGFMELMTDKGYYPQVSTWYLMPKLMGASRPIGWMSVSDIGTIAAKGFALPEQYIGRDIRLASDVKSIEECRAIYREVMGREPSSFPMPVWLFKRFVGDDLTTMWAWLRTGEIDFDTESTFTLHPEALSVDTWLRNWKRPQAMN